MKIAYVSDTHHEFGSQIDIRLEEPVDVLVLAGDIDSGKKLVERASKIANGMAKHVVLVCGNHEFYGERVDKVHRRIVEDLEAYEATHEQARESRKSLESMGLSVGPGAPFIHFLKDTFVDIGGFRFAGSTCWTDFELDGNPYLAQHMAEGAMNDYRRIKFFDAPRGIYRKLKASDVMSFNLVSKQFLFDQIGQAIAEGRDRKLIVVTHHGPTHMSLDPDFAGNELNPAYANNWGRKIAYEGGPLLWFSGHIHCRRRYYCGDTLCLTNPYGYPGQNPWAGISIIDTDFLPTQEEVDSNFDGFIPER